MQKQRGPFRPKTFYDSIWGLSITSYTLYQLALQQKKFLRMDFKILWYP